MSAYVLPEDKFDYCISCNYLEEIVATICPDSYSEEAPLCNVCAKEIYGEHLPTMEGQK